MKWLEFFLRMSQHARTQRKAKTGPDMPTVQQQGEASAHLQNIAPSGAKQSSRRQETWSEFDVRGILSRRSRKKNQEWDGLSACLHHIGDVRVAIRTLHALRQWGKADPERLRKDLLILLSLKHWWNVLPSSPWNKVAHLFTVLLMDHLHVDLCPSLVPLLQSRDPLVRERAARALKKLGFAPRRRIEMARYVVAKRNLRAVGHLANKIPRTLREAMPSERFLEWSKGKWMFLPADDILSDLVFAVEALERIPVKSINTVPAVELLLDFCGSSQTYRERALLLLQHVPEDSRVWKHAHVQRRLQAMHALSGVFQTAEINTLRRFEDQERNA